MAPSACPEARSGPKPSSGWEWTHASCPAPREVSARGRSRAALAPPQVARSWDFSVSSPAGSVVSPCFSKPRLQAPPVAGESPPPPTTSPSSPHALGQASLAFPQILVRPRDRWRVPTFQTWGRRGRRWHAGNTGHLLSSGLESSGCWALGVCTCQWERGLQTAAEAPGSHSYPRVLALSLKCSHFPASKSSRIRVSKVSPHHLLMFPTVLDIWKTDSFLEVACFFLGFY